MTFLLDNPNRHAPGGFWGYRSRSEDVRLLVVHTSESPFDTAGADTGAEGVANYLSNTDRAASYHAIGDSDSLVRLLPYDFTAFGARGHNSHAVHLAFAGTAADWPKMSDAQVEARLSVLASEARAVCDRFGIPVVRLQDDAARTDTARGICGHADVDPDRRSDPGAQFPWGRFLQMIEGDDMPLTEAEWERLGRLIETKARDGVHQAGFGRGDNVETFARRVADIKVAARGADAKAEAALKLLEKIAAGDTLTDEQIAQTVRDAAKNIQVDVTVTPGD